MFLHKLSKCSVHQSENTDSVEAEARPDVESQTAVAAEAIANSPLGVIAPPWKLPPVPCSQQKDLWICSCTFLHRQQTQPHQLERAKGTGAGIKPTGQGRRCRSTPSTGRGLQTVRATTAGRASRFTGMLHTLEGNIRIFFQKVAPDKENTLRKKIIMCLKNYNHLNLFFWCKERSSVMG